MNVRNVYVLEANVLGTKIPKRISWSDDCGASFWVGLSLEMPPQTDSLPQFRRLRGLMYFLRGGIWHIYSVLKASVMLRVFENILYYISVLNLFLHIFGQYIPTVSRSVNDRLACKIAPEEKSSKFKTTCDSMISLHLDQLH